MGSEDTLGLALGGCVKRLSAYILIVVMTAWFVEHCSTRRDNAFGGSSCLCK